MAGIQRRAESAGGTDAGEGDAENASPENVGEENADGENIGDVIASGKKVSGQVKRLAEKYEDVTLAQEYSMPYNPVQIAGGAGSLDERFMQYGYGWTDDSGQEYAVRRSDDPSGPIV